MRIKVTHHLDDLESDLRTIGGRARLDMDDVLRANAYQGNRLARDFARVSAGKHGKHYHRAFSAEPKGALAWEYGPDSSKPQGGMSFEGGSRNQPPHNDLAKSLDIQGPKFARDAENMLSDLFWPS